MIYRMNSSSAFADMYYDDIEVYEKIGESCMIQADPSPIEYASIWKKIHISFDKGMIPDIQHHYGHLFLSEKAVQALGVSLKKFGELLEVEYDGKVGAIFNPLKELEADAKLSLRNDYGEPTSIIFNGSNLVFKTEFDEYYGVFCDDKLKLMIESNGLTGIDFDFDLTNIFDRNTGAMKPISH